MTIKAEFMAGTEIAEAFAQAIRVSNALVCNIEFDFNGVTCIARPGGEVRRGVQAYNASLIRGATVKFASS